MLSRQFFYLLIFITALSSLSAVQSESDDAKLCSTTFAGNILCPVSCFRADPVCGLDGVTYWCGCPDAHCAGTSVAKLGACDGNYSSVSGQALLLINIIWLTLLAFFLLFGFL